MSKVKCEKLYSKEAGCGSWKASRGPLKAGRGRQKVGRGRRQVGRGRKNVGRGRRKVNISQQNRKKRCKCYYKWFYTLKTFIFSGLCGVKVESRCSGAGAPSSSPFGRSAKKFFLEGSLRKYKSYQVFNFISSAAMAQLAKQAAGMQQQST